jgi:hypothetical protein
VKLWGPSINSEVFKPFDCIRDLINLIFELEEFYNIKFNDKDLQDKNFNKLNNIKNIIVKKIKK